MLTCYEWANRAIGANIYKNALMFALELLLQWTASTNLSTKAQPQKQAMMHKHSMQDCWFTCLHADAQAKGDTAALVPSDKPAVSPCTSHPDTLLMCT